MNRAKQCPQGAISRCSLCEMGFQNRKKDHLMSIMFVFVWSIAPALMKTIGASDVAKKGVSRISSISLKQKFFGAGKWIVSPSSAWRRSAHAIIVGFHRKSFKRMTSACSAPTHAKEPVAGLQNVSFSWYTPVAPFPYPYSNMTIRKVRQLKFLVYCSQICSCCLPNKSSHKKPRFSSTNRPQTWSLSNTHFQTMQVKSSWDTCPIIMYSK